MFAGKSLMLVEQEVEITFGEDGREQTERYLVITQEKEVSYQEVTTGGTWVPDPSWALTTCPCGREHRWAERQVTHAREVATNTYWCDTCRDEHTDYEWRCDLADVQIEPGRVHTGPQTARVPTSISHTAHVLISRAGEPWMMSRRGLRGVTMWQREGNPAGPPTERMIGRFDAFVAAVEDNVVTLRLRPHRP